MINITLQDIPIEVHVRYYQEHEEILMYELEFLSLIGLVQAIATHDPAINNRTATKIAKTLRDESN